jgi:mannose-6-phosphate isomerase-like protein (cupin superfamily)
MKRQVFLQSCLAAGAVLVAPIKLIARTAGRLRTDAGFLVAAGKDRSGKPIGLMEGDTFYTKVSTKDTDGDIYVFESTRVKEGGPSHHYHFEQDEWWYVLEGEFLIKVGDVTHTCKRGDSVYGPRMVPHSFAKVGPGLGKLLMYFQPAGKMEEFFIKISQGAAKGMSEAEQDALREAHGFKRVGPPITYEKKM